MDGKPDVFHVRSHFQRQHCLGDQLAGVHADDAGAQDAARLRIEQYLGHAFFAADGQRAPRCRPGE